MMEAAHLWDRHHAAIAWLCNGTRDRRVLLQRQMCSGMLVIRAITCDQPLEAAAAEDDDVIETLASNRSDEPFGVGILPVRTRWVRTSSMPMAFADSAHPSKA